MRRKRIFLAVCLLAASVTGLVQPASAAEEKLQWQYGRGFKDAATKRSYYEAYVHSGNLHKFRVIYAAKEGTWFSLPERYWGIGLVRPDGTYFLNEYATVAGTLLSRSVYDPARDHITHEIPYIASPNGKWGLFTADHYVIKRRGTGKELIVLIKDLAKGQVRKLGFPAFYSGVRWMPDNRLLANVYSEEAKQNEILAIDPETGRTQRLLLASLYAYDAKSQSILFAYNEPARTTRIYNVKTGEIRTATEADKKRFYTGTDPAGNSQPETPEIKPPADLQPDQLPQGPITETTVDEAVAVINGQTIGLPAAFLEGSRAWIPVQPLIDLFDIRVKNMKDLLSSVTFRLEGPAGSIDLDETNSRNYGGRLFLSKDQLQRLGLHLEQLKWQPRSKESL